MKAFVTMSEQLEEDLRNDIQVYVRGILSKHEYPKVIEAIDEMPTTPDGKIQRKKLREREGVEKGG